MLAGILDDPGSQIDGFLAGLMKVEACLPGPIAILSDGQNCGIARYPNGNRGVALQIE